MRAGDDDPGWWRRGGCSGSRLHASPVWIWRRGARPACGRAAWLPESVHAARGDADQRDRAQRAALATLRRGRRRQKIDAMLATGTDEPPRRRAARRPALPRPRHLGVATASARRSTSCARRSSTCSANLTWVPHTLCATHGEQSAIADGRPRPRRAVRRALVARGVAARGPAPRRRRAARREADIESRLAAGKDGLGATIGATPAAGTVFRVRGCPKFR